jgi:hypothetical protein
VVVRRLLAPVELRAGRSRVDAGQQRQHSVLAALALDAGRLVPVGTLVDRVRGRGTVCPGTPHAVHLFARIRQTVAAASAAQDCCRECGSRHSRSPRCIRPWNSVAQTPDGFRPDWRITVVSIFAAHDPAAADEQSLSPVPVGPADRRKAADVAARAPLGPSAARLTASRRSRSQSGTSCQTAPIWAEHQGPASGEVDTDVGADHAQHITATVEDQRADRPEQCPAQDHNQPLLVLVRPLCRRL